MASAIIAEHVTYPSDSAAIEAYLARPTGSGPWPAVIVIHEIWGLDPHIEDITRRFVSEGYVGLAPNLYSRHGMPVSQEEIATAMAFMQTLPPEARTNPTAIQSRMATLPESERTVITRTLQWLQTRDTSQSVADLRAGLAWLQKQPDVKPHHIAVLGFCMGGGLAGRLAATGADVTACVISYGENPPLDQVPNIHCPVLGLYGGEDHRITDTVPDLAAVMAQAGKSFTYQIYPGAPHAFFNDTRATYRPEAATNAWQRVLAFFQIWLKQAG